jgi:hypothetical protein
MLPSNLIPVAIVGAGPYGLSLAAYLRRAGVAHRIFGSAMASWRTQMPTTMFLKSEGFASNLAQPDREMTLRDFCEESGYAYRDYGLPIPLHVFIKYGLAFQRHFAPDLEDTVVSEIRRHDRGFALLLGTGEQVLARNVVIATGIDPYRYMPTALAGLPSQLRSHTADHSDYSTFRGRRVCVIGAGASATDTAAALHAAGAHVQLVTRSEQLLWITPRTKRPLVEAWFKRDVLGAGRFGQGHIYSDAPQLFRYLPEKARLHIAATFLGPRGGWPVRECVEKLSIARGFTLDSAKADGSRAVLQLSSPDGKKRRLEADHVIAGTGYRLDLQRLWFLDPALRLTIKTLRGAPALSPHFESSVPGLYFTGVNGLYDFGPLTRFVAGTHFASKRISRQLTAAVRETTPFTNGRSLAADRLVLRGIWPMSPSDKR